MFEGPGPGHEGGTVPFRAPSTAGGLGGVEGPGPRPGRGRESPRPGRSQEEASSVRKSGGKLGPDWRPAPNTHTHTHRQTQTRTAHCKTALAPRRDLPWRFTWPGPRTPPGTSPCVTVWACVRQPVSASEGPPHPPGRASGRAGLGAWQRPRRGHPGRLSGGHRSWEPPAHPTGPPGALFRAQAAVRPNGNHPKRHGPHHQEPADHSRISPQTSSQPPLPPNLGS